MSDLADTPEAMRREIDGEVRLRMHRPGLLPGIGRDARMDQRVFDALTLRRDGLTYAEIGRRLGRCAQVVRNYCDWYGATVPTRSLTAEGSVARAYSKSAGPIEIDYEYEAKRADGLSPAERRAQSREVVAARRTRRGTYLNATIKKTLAAENGPVCEGCSWDARSFGFGEKEALRLLHAHHIVPLACDGRNDAGNAALLCPNCHAIAHHRSFGYMTRLDNGTREWEGTRGRKFFIPKLRRFINSATSAITIPSTSEGRDSGK